MSTSMPLSFNNAAEASMRQRCTSSATPIPREAPAVCHGSLVRGPALEASLHRFMEPLMSLARGSRCG